LARFGGEKLAFTMIVAQDSKRVLSDANANTGARVGALLSPQAEAIQEILRIKFGVFDQTFSQAKGHRRVISPRPGRKLEIPASTHSSNWLERVAPAELHRGAKGIPDSQPNDCTQGAISYTKFIKRILHRLDL
jgi:hypothetical protein